MPLPKWVARINRRIFNPIERQRGTRPVLTHVGRVSGKTYRTPLDAHRVDDGFVFIIMYGSDCDWVRNILAAGHAELAIEGGSQRLDRPRLIGPDEAARMLPSGTRAPPRFLNVTEYLHMRTMWRPPDPASNATPGDTPAAAGRIEQESSLSRPMDRLSPAEGMGLHQLASDKSSLSRHFGTDGSLLPLWIAEPYVDLAAEITESLAYRAAAGWYGYETRSATLIDAFWAWMESRHNWAGSGLRTSVSPSVGTSIGVLIEELSDPGDGVLIQPPVFTDFKPLIQAADRSVVRNPLTLTDGGYRMDLEHLESKAADPAARILILCNPHNPVGRVWTREELMQVADICIRHDVFVIADEIHADLTLPPERFTPFASVGSDRGVGWAATHGPIKTFGLAGVCDTLMITDRDEIAARFRSRSSQLHLTRNHVFGLAAFETAYINGAAWLDGLLDLVVSNLATLKQRLPDGIDLVTPEGTYLAWLDFRRLGMDVPELAHWLSHAARLALSPGHWFGREGAGFARMTIAVPTETIEEAVRRLTDAVNERSG